jgi:uncharacterized membrane protein
MSELVAIAYPDPYRASEVMAALARLQAEHLVDLDDACVVIKGPDGKVKLQQAMNLTAGGALSGAFWGSLVGLLFLNPLLGAAVGGASGAAAGALTDIGINDNLMRELGATLAPGSSAIFVLVRKATPDKAVAEVAKFGGKVLRSSLTAEQEAKLQAALDGGMIPMASGVAGGAPVASATAPPTAPSPTA